MFVQAFTTGIFVSIWTGLMTPYIVVFLIGHCGGSKADCRNIGFQSPQLIVRTILAACYLTGVKFE